jgi:hypothetical protein
MAKSLDKSLINLNIIDVPKFSVLENSVESEIIDEKYLNIVRSTINRQLPVYQNFGSYESYSISPGDFELNLLRVPQLDDIQSIDPDIYYEGGIAKARVTIRIRNSSGKQLKGIDARLEIPEASGGTS